MIRCDIHIHFVPDQGLSFGLIPTPSFMAPAEEAAWHFFNSAIQVLLAHVRDRTEPLMRNSTELQAKYSDTSADLVRARIRALTGDCQLTAAFFILWEPNDGLFFNLSELLVEPAGIEGAVWTSVQAAFRFTVAFLSDDCPISSACDLAEALRWHREALAEHLDALPPYPTAPCTTPM